MTTDATTPETTASGRTSSDTTGSDTTASDRTGSDRLLRGVLIVAGVLAIGRGAVLVLFGLHPGAWLWIGIYLAAGSAVHDLLIGPLSVALGRILRRPLRNPIAGSAVRGAWLGAGTAVLVGIPLLGGARHRANPTVIPGRPVLNVFLAVVLMITGAVLVAALAAIAHRVRSKDHRPQPKPAAPLRVEPDASRHPEP